ncbi:MAG: HIT domain-containing protein [Pseudomonadota bacterium]
MSTNAGLLFENEHFVIEHSTFYRIAGLLFVIPKRSVTSLMEMTDAELALLGTTLRVANEAVHVALQPINIYSAKFGEIDRNVHFHIFPRTAELTAAYRRDTGAGPVIEAPKLISWAHSRYVGEDEFGDLDAAMDALKKYFSERSAGTQN